MNITHKVQEIFRQYQMYQETLSEWIHYDLNEEHHLVKKYSGAVIDKVTVNKMTKSILQEGVMLVNKADNIIQTLGIQSEPEFLENAIGSSLGFQFMMLSFAYEKQGHWAVSIEGGDVTAKVDSFLEENPDFITRDGKFKGCVFYQTDNRYNNVDVFDPTGNIMNDFSIFKNEATRNYERTLEGIKNPDNLRIQV